MNVALQMIHRQQGLSECFGERFAIGNADEQRTHKPGSLGYADGVHFVEAQHGFGQSPTHHRNDLTKMFARGQLRDHTAVLAVNIDLRSYHTGEDPVAIDDDRSSGLVTRRLNPENTYS